MKIKVFEGFAGYGGASYGLKRLKENIPDVDYEVVGYSEFDKYAAALFDANHKDKNGNPLKNWGDITQINPDDCLWEDFPVSLSRQLVCRWEQKIHMDVVQCLDILFAFAR